MPAPTSPGSVPAIMAPPVKRDNPLTRSVAGIIGLTFLAGMLLACIATLPWTFPKHPTDGTEVLPESARREASGYDEQVREARHLPPWWAPGGSPARPGTPAFAVTVKGRSDADVLRLTEQAQRYWDTAQRAALVNLARAQVRPVDELIAAGVQPTPEQIDAARPRYWMGTDLLGRSLLVRCLVGGGISLGIGLAAATISVFIGTLWGTIAGWCGGRVDEVMMRIVDVLYGLPYILLVVLLAVAGDALLSEHLDRERTREAYVREQAAEQLRSTGQEPTREAVLDILKKQPKQAEVWRDAARAEYPERVWSPEKRLAFDLVILLVAIGGVSWLTMARVVRGQVLSLKGQPFIEAARAIGVPWHGIFLRHLLPNLVGPIVVYATLTVPQAILQESFLSFLGIGVKPPLPSWGSLAADGLSELNLVDSKWWLLLFPCVLLAATLLALNFVGEGLREALDPRRARRG